MVPHIAVMLLFCWYSIPADVEGGVGAPEGEGALPSSRLAAPLKGTKLGSATSGSDVLSAKPHSMFSLQIRLDLGRCSHTAGM